MAGGGVDEWDRGLSLLPRHAQHGGPEAGQEGGTVTITITEGNIHLGAQREDDDLQVTQICGGGFLNDDERTHFF